MNAELLFLKQSQSISIVINSLTIIVETPAQ